MVRFRSRLLTLFTLLRLTLSVACTSDGGPALVTEELSMVNGTVDGRDSGNGVDLAPNTDIQIMALTAIEIVFLLFNLVFLGSAMHDWVGPPVPKPPPRGEEPYQVTFEIGSDDGGKTGRLDGAGGQQPNIHIYDDKGQEIGNNNDTVYLWENAMHRASVKPNEYMGGKPPKYLTLMARGNNPICLTSVVVAGPTPDGRPYGMAAITPMSCGLKWASSGRQQYHNLTSVSYKPCFWFGAPFPEYLQVDLEFSTSDDSRKPWLESLNKTGKEKLIHEKFCNTLKHFHTRDAWPPEPFHEAIVTDETVLGTNPYPLNQAVIDANMVNRTGLRMDPIAAVPINYTFRSN